jgi:hypothetical protein
MSSAIISQSRLGFPFACDSPFLFAVYHLDKYPPGGKNLGPDPRLLRGRNIGSDFGNPAGWSMYHGDQGVPGFPKHPHRGFETITVTRRGLVDHTDSLGNGGRFGFGDAQWMTAGSGISHAEMFPLLDQKNDNILEHVRGDEPTMGHRCCRSCSPAALLLTLCAFDLRGHRLFQIWISARHLAPTTTRHGCTACACPFARQLESAGPSSRQLTDPRSAADLPSASKMSKPSFKMLARAATAERCAVARALRHSPTRVVWSRRVRHAGVASVSGRRSCHSRRRTVRRSR